MYFHHTLRYKTEKQLQIIDITDEMKKIVHESGVKNGMVNVQSLHTTTAVLVNEKESLLHHDFRKHLDHIAPQDIDYQHDDFSVRTENMCDGECANGHAHCKALHLPTSVTLNIKDNSLMLGTWQRILFLELDRARNRSVHITVLGE